MNTVQISLNEYISSIQLNHAISKNKIKIYALVIIVSIVAGCFLWLQQPGTLAGGLVGGPIGCVAGHMITRHLVIPWKARKLYFQHKSLQEQINYSWSPSALSIKAESAESSTPWVNYLRWRENSLVFNIYQTDLLFQIIPKRIFRLPEEESEFRELLTQVENA